MNSRLSAIVDFFIPDKIRGDQELYRKGRLLIISCLLILIFCLAYGVFYLSLGVWEGGALWLYGWVNAMILMLVFRKKGNFTFAANYFAGLALVFFIFFAVMNRGMDSSLIAWYAVVPVSAFLYGYTRDGILWTIITVCVIFLQFTLEKMGWVIVPELDDQAFPLVNLASTSGLILYFFGVVLVFHQGKRNMTRQLEKANAEIRQKSEALELAKTNLERKNEEITLLNQGLEEEVKQRTENLEASNKELDTFLYESSHALRRPLARIMGLVDIIRDETDPRQLAFFQGKIDFTTQNMDEMLRALLMVSEINHHQVAPEKIEVKSLLGELKQELKPSLKAAGIRIENDLSGKLAVVNSPKLLRIVLNQLLENAIRFRDPENPDSSIRILSHLQDGEIQLLISDNGAGIHPKAMPHIFDMFYKGTERSEGSGLGLYIVQKAMERMNGNVEVSVEEAGWTTFLLTFPRKLPVSGSLPVVDAQEQSGVA